MPDPNNQPVLESAVIDGAEATAEEQALIDAGVAETGEDGDGTAPPAAAGAADDDAAAAGQAEAERLAAEQEAQAAQAEEERLAALERDQQERANAEAARNAEAIAAAQGGSEKPAPPQDFDKAFEDLATKLDDGDIEQADYQRELRKLSKAEAEHGANVRIWEAEQQRLQQEAAAATARNQNEWNAAALKWEADNADFMSNPLRASHMQQAIGLVVASGKHLAPSAILAEAQKMAFDYSGYKAPEPVAPRDPKAEIANAVAQRKPEAAPATLGGVPNAGNDPIRGDEAFGRLDSLKIEDLEETVQNMTARQLEDYLKDAPGAKANGRGNDPTDD